MKFLREFPDKNHNIHSLDGIITHWNVSKITLITILNILLHGINLIKEISCINILLFSSGVLLLVASRVYYIYNRKILTGRYGQTNISDIIFISFWLVFFISYIPLFIGDVLAGRSPYNLVILYCILITVPVFTSKKAILLFIPPAILNIVFSFIYSKNKITGLYVVIFSFFSFITAYFAHRSFIYFITNLQTSGSCDALTGLSNRQSGMYRALQLFEVCKRNKKIFAVHMIDIDDFKRYNDTYGHLSGDEVLKHVAKAFNEVFTRREDVIYRYGGEEFIICISSESEKSIFEMVEELREKIANMDILTYKIKQVTHITVSVGCAIYIPCEDNQNVELIELIDHADKALYKAKEKGKNVSVILKTDDI